MILVGTRQHKEQLTRLACEDAFTGLPNRYWLLHSLPVSIERAGDANQKIGLLFVDLGGFQHVNNTKGHQTGDELLKVAARN